MYVYYNAECRIGLLHHCKLAREYNERLILLFKIMNIRILVGLHSIHQIYMYVYNYKYIMYKYLYMYI